MAITVTKTVTGLTILNNADNIVSEVEVTTKSVDDSDPSTLTIEATENFTVDSSGGTGASGFVAFGSLSETVVKNWVSAELATSNTKTNAEAWINSVKTPPTPAEKEKALPW